jgi:hypothetical protein
MPAVYGGGMNTQNQIKRTLEQTAAIETIRLTLEDQAITNRTQLADRLCEHFDLRDPRGHLQRAGCLRALRELERAGHFRLPPTRVRAVFKVRQPRRLSAPVPPAHAVPAQAQEVRALELVVVESEEQLRVWNELMLGEHPRGAGPLVGRQLRYLVASEYGWLGALGFASAALRLKDRDQWIGWDEHARSAHLQRVVGMSRFLIRPGVRCRNLASRVLGAVQRRIGEDYETKYAIRPWLLETFLDTETHHGGCYRAANWLCIGRTAGRGRQDRHTRSSETVKAVYVYPLAADFRARMGITEAAGPPALAPGAGLDAPRWAEQEFGGAPLGDRRLSRRLVDSARLLAQKPGCAFSAAAEGERARVKAYYRMIDHPDSAAVSPEDILAPHRQRTLQRMKAHATVLCIQDGTDLNYTSLAQCRDLGIIGGNQTGAKTRGLHLHCTLAVTTDGLPLGVMRAQCWAPSPKSSEDARPSTAIPIEEKETYCWIRGLRDCRELAEALPGTRLVNVLDREADFYELFDDQRRNPGVDLLVRAQYNRNTTENLKLFESLRASPQRARLSIHVERQSAREKKSKQKAKPGRAARTARVALHYRRVEFRPPSYHKDKGPLSLQALYVRETDPPAGVEPIEWCLLTTLAVTSVQDAETCLRWYCLRWRIEDWHRVLKSGCGVEDLRHESAERLKRAIAIRLVIAWRIMLMTLLGRECPNLPAAILFSELEIAVLKAYAKKKPSASDSTRRGCAPGRTHRRVS